MVAHSLQLHSDIHLIFAQIPRIWRGKPIDYLLTRRLARIQATLESMFTYSSGWIHNQVINLVCVIYANVSTCV